MRTPPKAFISYSHKDEQFKLALEKAFALLTRQGLIQTWSDRRIDPGGNWETVIETELQRADIIFLLITPDFLASDFCYTRELSEAIRRHSLGQCTVIPIFCRHCDWEGAPFDQLQGLPRDAKPVAAWTDQDYCWTQISREVRAILHKRKPTERSEKRTPVLGYRELLERAIAEYDGRSWTARYLPLATTDWTGRHVPDLAELLLEWARDRLASPLLLLGGCGAGKTWALKRLARDIAAAALTAEQVERVPVPFYIHLPTCVSDAGFSLERGLGVDAGVFSSLPAEFTRILLVDSLDEIALTGTDNAMAMLRRLFSCVPGAVRMLLACRKEIGAPLAEALRLLLCERGVVPPEDATQWATETIIGLPRVLTIDDLSPQLASSYFTNCDAATVRQLADRHPEFKYLFKRPMLLPLLESALPELDQHGVNPTLSNIYDRALRVWLLRDKRCRAAGVLESGLDAVRLFALRAFPHGTLSFDDFAEMCGSREMAHLLINCGLFEANSRHGVSLCHQSFYEYGFAAGLAREIVAFNAKTLSRSNLVAMSTVNLFLHEMLPTGPRATEAGRDVRRAIQCTACRLPDSPWVVSGLVTLGQYMAFMEQTMWRMTTGYGVWLTLEDDHGRVPVSGSLEGLGNLSYSILDAVGANCTDSPATGVSWYDAWAFCWWIGARLPTAREVIHCRAYPDECREWTGDWFDKINAQMRVVGLASEEALGVNPDLRSDNLGFRVAIDMRN